MDAESQLGEIPGHLGGLVVGILDCQLLLSNAFCVHLGIDPAALAKTFDRLVEIIAKQGGSPDFIAARSFTASALAQSLVIKGTQPGAQVKPAPALTVISGGLMRAEDREADDGDDKNDEKPAGEPAEPR